MLLLEDFEELELEIGSEVEESDVCHHFCRCLNPGLTEEMLDENPDFTFVAICGATCYGAEAPDEMPLCEICDVLAMQHLDHPGW